MTRDIPIELTLPLDVLAKIFWGGTIFLMLTGLAVVALKFGYRKDHVYGLYALFDLNSDSSVPTWFASVTLLICAALLAIHARITARLTSDRALPWIGLSALFSALSVDETARIHEVLGTLVGTEIVRSMPVHHGLPSYHWVIAGLIFVVVVVAIYLPFVWRLPSRFRLGVLTSGAVYVGGALVVEDFNGFLAHLSGSDTLAYQLGTVVEETLEMSGVALFAQTLVAYLAYRISTLKLEARLGKRVE